MGCWLGTCGISGLPINYNDKVKCFIIASSLCTPIGQMFEVTNLALPLCFPISGKYNGYGSIKVSLTNKTENHKIILDAFNTLVSNKMVKNYSKKVKNIDDLLNLIEREYVDIEKSALEGFTTDINCALFMIHEDIYKILMDEETQTSDFKISTIMNCYNVNNKKTINGDNGNEVDLGFFYKNLYEFEAKTSPIFALYEDSIKNGTINKKYLNKELINYYKLLRAMDGLRKMFQSHVGTGSQYFNNKLFKKIQKESSNLIKRS